MGPPRLSATCQPSGARAAGGARSAGRRSARASRPRRLRSQTSREAGPAQVLPDPGAPQVMLRLEIKLNNGPSERARAAGAIAAWPDIDAARTAALSAVFGEQ
eukprot:299682-Pyramimonas_sp.AAC.1